MLRIAVPNKGSLAEPAAEMLREAGYRSRRDSQELILADPDNDVEFFFLRPRDIAVYVGSGTLDVGITGRDLLLDSGSRAGEVMPLGFGRLDLPVRRAGRASPTSVQDVGGLRVATSYPGWSRAHLTEQGVSGRRGAPGRRRRDRDHASVSPTSSPTSSRPAPRCAGRAGGLRRADPAQSEAVLIAPRRTAPTRPAIDVLVRRLQGVLTARSYVMMDYDVRVELVERPCALTPGLESPTVSPAARQGLGRRAGDGAARDAPTR